MRAYRWAQEYQTPAIAAPLDQAAALAAWFKEGEPTTSTADRVTWSGDTDEWLTAHTTGRTLSPAVGFAVKPFIDGEPFDGHQRMLKFQIHLVKLAVEGHRGVPEALAFARSVWLSSAHYSDEDPVREWDRALDNAIQNFGGTR